MPRIPTLYRSRARVSLAVLLGLATSIAIAWRIAYLVQTSLTYTGHSHRCLVGAPDHPTWLCHEIGPGFEQVDAVGEWITPPDTPVPDDVRADYPIEDYAIPSWAGMPDEATSERQIKTIAAGWPFLCLAGGYRAKFAYTGGQKHLSYRSVNMIYQVPVGFSSSRGLFPIGILWRGLLADTVLWGAPWWCALLIPALIRRRWRSKRNRCRACGYSRAGLASGAPCPECGAGL